MEILSRKDARAIGAARYFTGKPCKRGHVTQRITTSALCVECNRVIQRASRKRIKLADHRAWKTEIEEPQKPGVVRFIAGRCQSASR